jgi:undecaprenyl pyrophosphate phosphatase UppP
MKAFLANPLINVLAAVVGGILLGFGIGQLFHTPSVTAGVSALAGLLLLWWAVFDRRKAKTDVPESERDGSHTIE